MEVGGHFFKVIKLTLTAVSTSDETQYYPLFEAKVTVRTGNLVSEVKRVGHLFDIHLAPQLDLRKGDQVTVYL
jgi:hypothetical protein